MQTVLGRYFRQNGEEPTKVSSTRPVVRKDNFRLPFESNSLKKRGLVGRDHHLKSEDTRSAFQNLNVQRRLQSNEDARTESRVANWEITLFDVEPSIRGPRSSRSHMNSPSSSGIIQIFNKMDSCRNPLIRLRRVNETTLADVSSREFFIDVHS